MVTTSGIEIARYKQFVTSGCNAQYNVEVWIALHFELWAWQDWCVGTDGRDKALIVANEWADFHESLINTSG